MSDVSPELLSAYLDGECTPAECAAVEARLATDPAWQAELEDVRSARDAVRALPKLDLPQSCIDAVAATIAAQDATGSDRGNVVPMRSSKRRGWMYGAVGGLGATVAAAAAFVFLVPAPASDRPVRPAVAAFADVHSARAASMDEPVAHVVTASLDNAVLARQGGK